MDQANTLAEQIVKYQTALVILNTITPVTIALIGWFVKRTIERIEIRLDKHETSITDLVGNVQRIIGRNEVDWDGRNRRRI